MELKQVILTGLIGLFTGALGSIVAPWVKWGIEKRRLRYNNRLELIKGVKLMIMSENFDRGQFINQSDYYIIKKHLSEKSINFLESSSFQIKYQDPNDPFDYNLKSILIDISNLEKK